MEKPSEILKSLEERVTNPLLASFFFAFFTYNWKIAVALFLYSPERIRQFGYIDHFYFIEANIRLDVPIYIAVSYTIAFPIIKYCLITWAKYIKLRTESLYLNWSKDESVPVERYLELDKKHEEKTPKFEKYLTVEKELREEISTLNAQIRTIRLELKKERDFTEFTTKFNDAKNFAGSWLITNMFDALFDSISDTRTYEITEHAEIFWISDDDKDSRTLIGTIETIAANPLNNTVFVHLKSNAPKDAVIPVILKRNTEGNRYEGTYPMKGNEQLIMVRIK